MERQFTLINGTEDHARTAENYLNAVSSQFDESLVETWRDLIDTMLQYDEDTEDPIMDTEIIMDVGVLDTDGRFISLSASVLTSPVVVFDLNGKIDMKVYDASDLNVLRFEIDLSKKLTDFISEITEDEKQFKEVYWWQQKVSGQDVCYKLTVISYKDNWSKK